MGQLSAVPVLASPQRLCARAGTERRERRGEEESRRGQTAAAQEGATLRKARGCGPPRSKKFFSSRNLARISACAGPPRGIHAVQLIHPESPCDIVISSDHTVVTPTRACVWLALSVRDRPPVRLVVPPSLRPSLVRCVPLVMLRRSLHVRLALRPASGSALPVAHAVAQLQHPLCACLARPAAAATCAAASRFVSSRAATGRTGAGRRHAATTPSHSAPPAAASPAQHPADPQPLASVQNHPAKSAASTSPAAPAAATADSAAATAAAASASASSPTAAPADPASTSASLPSTSNLYTNFADMGVPSALVARLDSLGIRSPTLIQQRVIPFLARYNHTGVLVQSPTGTGKSLAFLLPVLSKLINQRMEAMRTSRPLLPGIQAVIILPTQELAMQTHAQLHALLAPSAGVAPLGSIDSHFTSLCIGGFESVEDQRESLKAHPPTILVGTPRRLNSVFFPAYETHGRWKDKQRADKQIAELAAREAANAGSAPMPSRQSRPREVIFDPPEDDHPADPSVASDGRTPLPLVSETTAPNKSKSSPGTAAAGTSKEQLRAVEGWLDPADWAEEEDDEDAIEAEPGKGESHKAPNFTGRVRTLRESRLGAMEAEYLARSNIARVAQQGNPLHERKDDADDDEDDEEESDPSLDGVDELFLPPRHAVGFEAQKLLRMKSGLARRKIQSPLKRLISSLQFLVIDEADDVLQPLSKFAGERLRANRQRHPKPAQVFVRGLSLLNPTVQLIAVSATINSPFRLLVSRLGFWRPKPVQIRIASRTTGFQAAAEAAIARERAAKALADAQAGQVPATTDATAAPPDAAAPVSSSTSLTSPNFSDVASWRNYAREVGLPLSLALMYNLSCPPNLKHFYVLAPDWAAWRQRRHHEPADFPKRMEYDHAASEEKRQAVHEHNLHVKLLLRRRAHLMDKLASLAVLLDHFQPRCTLLVVPDPQPSTQQTPQSNGAGGSIDAGERQFNLQTLSEHLSSLGLSPAILFHHLSTPSLEARARFFADLHGGKYNVLLVHLGALRGLDVPECDLVVLLTPPHEAADYVHAAGRTGRMGREGSVVTLLHPEELAKLDGLTRYMPETLADAKQIMLPATVRPQLHADILQLYKRSLPQRRAAAARMAKDIAAKMHKRVTSDEQRDAKDQERRVSPLQQLEREEGRLRR